MSAATSRRSSGRAVRPARVSVPTCIGCGAMNLLGGCDTGCTDQKLELARAAAYDELCAAVAETEARVGAFRHVAEVLASGEPALGEPAASEAERAYRALQLEARESLRRHPEPVGHDLVSEAPTELATTWWCAGCGAIEAPQPCIGVCIWRPVEWVDGALYERAGERASELRAVELRLRRLLGLVAWVTPAEGEWARARELFAEQAREALGAEAA